MNNQGHASNGSAAQGQPTIPGRKATRENNPNHDEGPWLNLSDNPAYLLIHSHDYKGVQPTITLLDTTLLGRGVQADARLENLPGVSRKHARIVRQGHEYSIEDLGSSFGTRVNRNLLRTPKTLKQGDSIELGEFKAEFRLGLAPAQTSLRALNLSNSPGELRQHRKDAHHESETIVPSSALLRNLNDAGQAVHPGSDDDDTDEFSAQADHRWPYKLEDAPARPERESMLFWLAFGAGLAAAIFIGFFFMYQASPVSADDDARKHISQEIPSAWSHK